jgi:CheY-like chemotaxis protein
MKFHRLTQIFSRTRSAPLRYEECSGIGKKKILIVDDNSDLRKLLALVLKNSDYDTVEAATGLEALKQAHATRPDLILMDLFMPDVTGDEVMARLKADPVTRNIPVIVTTAFLDGPHVDRAIALGAADIINKPFHFASLHAMLQRCLSVNHSFNNPKNIFVGARQVFGRHSNHQIQKRLWVFLHNLVSMWFLMLIVTLLALPF